MDRRVRLPLSPSEIALLRLVVQGATLTLIAYDLNTSEAIAMARLRTLFKKIGVENRSEAVRWARANGFTSDRAGPDPTFDSKL